MNTPKMRSILSFLVLLNLASVPLFAADVAMPNIVFLLADDLGCGDRNFHWY